MGLKTYKPTSAGKRFQISVQEDELYKGPPCRSLTAPLSKSGGRNNYGRMTARHRGGGHKRRYRIIDFKRNKFDVPGTIARIEYDPSRTAFIALVHYADGEKRYILAPQKVGVGTVIVSGERVDIKPGNALPLKNIPVGTILHNIELKPHKGGQLARSAGNYGQLMGKEGQYAQLKMPSGEMRKVLLTCMATIGLISNSDHGNTKLGKAGRNRWKGIRPSVRGVAMNPVDHPHGGGEGRTSGGRHPCTPWGVSTKGKKTRRKRASSEKLIMRHR
jgi:large subunit ribosomal protein L2